MQTSHEIAWNQARRILCIRLDALGDLLMTAPAMRALKAAGPERHITLLTSPAGQAAADYLSGVDQTLIYEAPWMKATAIRSKSARDFDFITQLRDQAFDAAIIFTVFSQNPLPAALTCYLADIPLRIAYCRENPYQLLTHWLPELEPQLQTRHEVKRHLDLVAALGCPIHDERMQLDLPESARLRARRICQELGLDLSRPWLMIHPGATAASRRYPPQKFARVARTLVLDHGYQIVFTGSQQERPIWEDMQAELPRKNIYELFGVLSFLELCGLIASTDLLLSNNTAPVHIAASLGTPVVDLYALTNPQHTPWMVPHKVLSHDVPCRNCYKSVCPQGHNMCLHGIETDAVVTAVLSLRQETQDRKSPS